MDILEWFRLGKVTTQKESHVESSLHERDDCVVNKFSISLVCGLRAQAADTVTFCFCLRELLLLPQITHLLDEDSRERQCRCYL